MVSWGIQKFSGQDAIKRLSEEVRAALPISRPAHDADWLNMMAGEGEGQDILVLTARDGDQLVGVAPYLVHPTKLSFSLGELTVFRKSVRRYAIDEGPVAKPSADGDVIDSSFAKLAECMKKGSVAFAEGVPLDSALQAAIDDRKSVLNRHFHVVPYGPVYPRYKIKWEGTFDAYLASLKSDRRSNLRRALKRFAALEGVSSELKRYEFPEDVGAFLDAAVPVSDKTYQKRLLGLGLSRTKAFERQLSEAAARGAFLGHVLFANGEAIAFQYGYLFQGTYFLTDTGYDPAWSKNEAGVVLFCNLLKDLEQHNVPVSLLDFLPGHNVFKERNSNLSDLERHYYLVRRSLSGALLAHSMVVTDRFSRRLGDLLEKYGLKARIKRLIRRAG